MPFVQLTRNRQGTLRRAVRDEAGNIVKDAAGKERWLEFPPRTPVLVKPDDLHVIAADLGGSLMPMEQREDGRFMPVDLQPDEILDLVASAAAASAVAGSYVVNPDPEATGIPATAEVPDPGQGVTETTAAEPASEPASPAGDPAAAQSIPDINTVLNGGANAKKTNPKK